MLRVAIDLFSAAMIGAMMVILSVSFASIVYSGPLEPFLDRGIGTTLLAATIAMIVGAFSYSYRGTIPMPQDLTAILLAGAASNIALSAGAVAPEVLSATILMLLTVTSAAAGLIMLGFGRFRLSGMVRLVPYPVMGGFLAATGYLLTLGAIGTLLGAPVNIWTISAIFSPAQLMIWLPWIVVGAGMVLATRLVPGGYTLPGAIALVCVGFYVVLWGAGLSLVDARNAGLMLGPFGTGGFLLGLDASVALHADWGLVASQSTTLLAVVAMTLIGAALNLSGIELAVREPMETDRDFIAVGLSNLLSAPTGGLLGFPSISLSILGHRLGLRGVAAGLMIAAIVLSAALFGAGLLEILPRGLFAATIAFLGLDLLVTWLWSERKRLMARDFSIVVLILIVSALLGFLQALALGLALSVILFVISYSRQSVLRLRSSLALRRSTSERSIAEFDTLTEVGGRVCLLEFSGTLFFGTAGRVQALVETELARDQGKPETLVLDFTRVPGIDPSVAHVLAQVEDICRSAEVDLVLTGMSDGIRAVMTRFGGTGYATTHDSFDDALIALEDDLLATHHRKSLGGDCADTFLDRLRLENPDVDLESRFRVQTLADGQRLFEEGDASDDMFIILSGAMNAVIRTSGTGRAVVARLREGALLGEIAYFGAAPRSTDMVAAGSTRLLRIDRDRMARLEEDDPAFVASFLSLTTMQLSRRLNRTTHLLGATLE